MKRIIIVAASLISGAFFFNFFSQNKKPIHTLMPGSFYDLKAKTIDGSDFNFESLRGKYVLIVNVASYCGYTGQYEGLQKLYEKFGSKLVILGFPCNQFGAQEPESNEKIKTFCTSKYNVTFQMMDKVDVKGEKQHDVFQWLTLKEHNGMEDVNIKWNFNKFLISPEGKYIKHFGSSVSPDGKEIMSFIQ